MKKTVFWSLISATMLSICVGSAAYAQEPKSEAVEAKPAVVEPTKTAVTAEPAKPAVVEASAFTPAQVEQLHTIIHDYLVKNPQVLVEASQALQADQEKQMQASAVGAIEQNKQALFNDPASPSMGVKTAPAIVVEFFDYQCGHCKAMAPTIEKLISEDKNVHIIFKELPIFGGMSDYAAKVALAAEMQKGKYYGFHNALFAATAPLTKDSIMAMAKKSGLDMEKLKKDMASPAIEKQIQSNIQLAQALKVMGTPTFVVANQAQNKFAYIPGATSLADLQDKIKSVQ